MLCPTEGVNTAVTPVLSSGILLITAIIGVAGLAHPTSEVAPAPAIATRAISAEAPLAQANNIQASASAVVAPIVSKVEPAPPQAPQTSSISPKWINPETKSILSPQGSIFQKWLDEDALYIITEEERLAFSALGSDAEREQFVQQFWLRRDPSPSTPVNEFKEEHYRRIAYANQRFGTASGRPGWATDRGAVHIVYGPPDELESHNVRPGGTSPFELWLYRYIEGKGADVIFEFADITETGDFRLVGPKPGAAAERVPQQLNARIEDVWVAGNRRIPTETILASLQTKPGGEFDQAVIAKDVKALMSLGLFEEVSVGQEKSPNGGPTVTFKVREAPNVRAIEYRGLRSVTIAEINQKLSDAKGGLAIEGPYSVEKATKTADVLKTLMASKGFNDFTVEVAAEPVPPNGVRVIFVVNEGTGQ
jgi:GWxTD domain-containing protein